jgi:hypothetical protein
MNETGFLEKCCHQLNPRSAKKTFNRHKECNEHPHSVPKVPFNKDLNRNTPPRAVLGGVFCVRGVAFKSYDVRGWFFI